MFWTSLSSKTNRILSSRTITFILQLLCEILWKLADERLKQRILSVLKQCLLLTSGIYYLPYIICLPSLSLFLCNTDMLYIKLYVRTLVSLLACVAVVYHRLSPFIQLYNLWQQHCSSIWDLLWSHKYYCVCLKFSHCTEMHHVKPKQTAITVKFYFFY